MATIPPLEDDVGELFRKIGEGNASGVAQIVHFRPELARCRNAAGLSVLQFARYMGEDAILRSLVEAGPPLDVFEASEVDDAECLASAVERDRELLRAHDQRGQTPLHVAAAAGSVQSLAVLIEAGAAREALSTDASAQTALHAAVQHLQVEAVRELLRFGADPNARRLSGETPLMIAAAANNRDIAEVLIARNANVDVRDSEGRTASDIAIACGHLPLAERLRLGERIVDRSRV